MRLLFAFLLIVAAAAVAASDDLDITLVHPGKELSVEESGAAKHAASKIARLRAICHAAPFESFQVVSIKHGEQQQQLEIELDAMSKNGEKMQFSASLHSPSPSVHPWVLTSLSPEPCNLAFAMNTMSFLDLEDVFDDDEEEEDVDLGQLPDKLDPDVSINRPNTVGIFQEIPVTADVQGAADHAFNQVNEAREKCGRPVFSGYTIVYATERGSTTESVFQIEIQGDDSQKNTFLFTVEKIPRFLKEFHEEGGRKHFSTREVVPDPCGDKQLAYTFYEIKQHNSNPSRTYDMQMYPQMLGQTKLAFATGYLPEENIPQELISVDLLQDVSIPTSYDFRTAFPECRATNEVLDQKSCGSCYAQAAATSFGASLHKKTNKAVNIKISAREMADCDRACDGGNCMTVYNYGKTRGFPEEYCDPDDGKKGTCGPKCQKAALWRPASFQAIRPNAGETAQQQERKIMAALVTYGPLWVAFDVHRSLHSVKSGIYTCNPADPVVGGHAVTLVGYGTENGLPYWIIQNSWSSQWAERGFFRIRRGQNDCRIETRSVWYVVPEVRPFNIQPSCQLSCRNAGSTQSDCSCHCHGNFQGNACERCSISSCPNGQTFEASRCVCECATGFSGTNCAQFVAKPSTTEVCKEGEGPELSISWNANIAKGSYCALRLGTQVQDSTKVEYCGPRSGWTKEQPNCPPSGTVKFNMAELRKLPAGTYGLTCAENLGKNEFGQERDFGWMARGKDLAAIVVKPSCSATTRSSPKSLSPTRGKAPLRVQTPTSRTVACGQGGRGRCVLRRSCGGSTTRSALCKAGQICCTSGIRMEEEEDVQEESMLEEQSEASTAELDNSLFDALYGEDDDAAELSA